MDIVPRLNLNKHPKDCTNLSLVNALNVKVSNDENCITNEELYENNEHLYGLIEDNYPLGYNIVACIPCNTEIVFFVKDNNVENILDIYRYDEITDKLIPAYIGKFIYHGGKIKGTFTYNVENSLIIAVAEYDTINNIKVPLRTINLGNSSDDTIYNDKKLPDALLSASPEINIPNLINYRYIQGNAYKGWYYLFIRFKINSVDYTQWFPFGYPIYVDTIEQRQIIRYCYNRDTKFADTKEVNLLYPKDSNDGFGTGCSDYFSSEDDVCNETFEANISFKDDRYKIYQIGVICASKSYNKSFRSSDKFIKENKSFIFDVKNLVEASISELVIDNYNYFNVGNIVNYKNRLYISNYNENTSDDKIPNDITKDIKITIGENIILDKCNKYDEAIIVNDGTTNQYELDNPPKINLADYLGVDKNTYVTVSYPKVIEHTSIPYYIEYLKISDIADNFILSTYRTTPTFNKNEHNINAGLITIGHKVDNIITWLDEVNRYDHQTLINGLQFKISIGEKDTIIIDIDKTGIIQGSQYINTKNGFNARKQQSTLIPGEVYNFFIHFVDKYGHSTNGYRIDNTDKVLIDNKEYIVDRIENVTGYFAIPIDNYVYIDGNVVNLTDIRIFENFNETTRTLSGEIPYSTSATSDYAKKIIPFKNTYKYFANNKYSNTKWFQIVKPYQLQCSVYINDNGDRLFRIPFAESFYEPIFSTTDNRMKAHTIYYPTFSGIKVPKGYVGYYISYEKFEPMQRVTGILTRNDFRSKDAILQNYNEDISSDNLLASKDTANNKKSNTCLFYSSKFDIGDSIKLDYNVLRVEGVNIFDVQDIHNYDFLQRNFAFKYLHDLNKSQTDSYKCVANLPITDYKLCVANNVKDDRIGVGTCLEIKDEYDLFNSYTLDTSVSNNSGNYNKINIYRVTLLNCTRNIYLSNNKTLIKLTDINYVNNNTDTYSITVRNGLNGHYTFDGVLIYENRGLIFNDADNKARQVVSNELYYKTEVTKEHPHTYENDSPFVSYVQFPVCDEYFYESKSFKNAPKAIMFYTKEGGQDASNNKFYPGCMVIPANSIDLFENKQSSRDILDPKTYTNYREDLVSIDRFDKTIRRSNVIQDETRVNGWRTFAIEGYKNITENKGKITNLVGLGTIFLVHTEHSMFMFDIDNTMKTKDKNIQLYQSDTFEVAYKEVFTSDLGYGGLQDDKSVVVDQFGYIFYNNDFNRFYRFDNGQLAYIDDDIIEYLRKYKPYNVRFANDKFNNRLLIRYNYKINNTVKNATISYNYNTKSFISFHDYDFKEAYNTKTQLYFLVDNDNVTNVCQFNTNKILFNKLSKISIIINENFDIIKYLEYITYKLSKVNTAKQSDYDSFPVEEMIIPYAGDTLKVYNDLTNTSELDITVDNESSKNSFGNYKKPYWELGNWNFSYLRNYNESNKASNMSRIIGNFFIVEFTFKEKINNSAKYKIEFEELKYSLSR